MADRVVVRTEGGGCCGCITMILAIIGLLYLVGCLPRHAQATPTHPTDKGSR